MTRNYNVYLSGMEKGNAEKLFFLQHVDLGDFDTVIDFGCGRGDILKACCNKNQYLKLIGVDRDFTMLDLARRNLPDALFVSKLEKRMINDRTLIIFSSVLHEVEEYWDELKRIISGTGATVVVRDMNFSDKPEVISSLDLAKLIEHANPKHLSEFIKRYGLITDKDMYHYLLKYSYVDNWELELAENYFSFNWKDLLGLGKVLYQNDYTLDFKKTRVLFDFGISLTKPTHTQLIIKLRKEQK